MATEDAPYQDDYGEKLDAAGHPTGLARKDDPVLYTFMMRAARKHNWTGARVGMISRLMSTGGRHIRDDLITQGKEDVGGGNSNNIGNNPSCSGSNNPGGSGSSSSPVDVDAGKCSPSKGRRQHRQYSDPTQHARELKQLPQLRRCTSVAFGASPFDVPAQTDEVLMDAVVPGFNQWRETAAASVTATVRGAAAGPAASPAVASAAASATATVTGAATGAAATSAAGPVAVSAASPATTSTVASTAATATGAAAASAAASNIKSVTCPLGIRNQSFSTATKISGSTGSRFLDAAATASNSYGHGNSSSSSLPCMILPCKILPSGQILPPSFILPHSLIVTRPLQLDNATLGFLPGSPQPSADATSPFQLDNKNAALGFLPAGSPHPSTDDAGHSINSPWRQSSAIQEVIQQAAKHSVSLLCHNSADVVPCVNAAWQSSGSVRPVSSGVGRGSFAGQDQVPFRDKQAPFIDFASQASSGLSAAGATLAVKPDGGSPLFQQVEFSPTATSQTPSFSAAFDIQELPSPTPSAPLGAPRHHCLPPNRAADTPDRPRPAPGFLSRIFSKMLRGCLLPVVAEHAEISIRSHASSPAALDASPAAERSAKSAPLEPPGPSTHSISHKAADRTVHQLVRSATESRVTPASSSSHSAPFKSFSIRFSRSLSKSTSIKSRGSSTVSELLTGLRFRRLEQSAAQPAFSAAPLLNSQAFDAVPRGDAAGRHLAAESASSGHRAMASQDYVCDGSSSESLPSLPVNSRPRSFLRQYYQQGQLVASPRPPTRTSSTSLLSSTLMILQRSMASLSSASASPLHPLVWRHHVLCLESRQRAAVLASHVMPSADPRQRATAFGSHVSPSLADPWQQATAAGSHSNSFIEPRQLLAATRQGEHRADSLRALSVQKSSGSGGCTMGSGPSLTNVLRAFKQQGVGLSLALGSGMSRPCSLQIQGVGAVRPASLQGVLECLKKPKNRLHAEQGPKEAGAGRKQNWGVDGKPCDRMASNRSRAWGELRELGGLGGELEPE